MAETLALIGMPGCGKTSIGRQAAERAGRPFADVDEIITFTHGSISALFHHGEGFFRQCETAALRQACALLGAVIATGGGIVVRAENIDILKATGIIVFIDRPMEAIIADIDWQTRPLLAGGEKSLIALYQQRLPLYRQYADFTIANNGSLEEACRKVIDILEGEK